MATEKFCPNCAGMRAVPEFTRDRSRRDGLAARCRQHAAQRLRDSKERRFGATNRRRVTLEGVEAGPKWCPDRSEVKALADFPTTASSRTGRHSYCRPCRNVRGKAALAELGGSRTYHLKRRYEVSASDAAAMPEAQGSLCAIGQFRDAPAALREAADYVERHRVRATDTGAGSRPGARTRPGNPPVGSPRRPVAVRRAGLCSRGRRRPAAGEADA
jgi:hypothetical protein